VGVLEVESETALAGIELAEVGARALAQRRAQRMSSPSGGSIFSTSAPMSAKRRAQYGPATMIEKSRTRRPARASACVVALA
jgi:hypothetical protein